MNIAPPYQESTAAYPLPFDLWPFQQQAVNDLAPRLRAAYYAEVGTGKTAMSTSHALYHILTGMAECYIITVPPILITAWCRWLGRIPGVRTLAYRGDPRERASLDLDGHHFIVMSRDIFKRDSERIFEHFRGRVVGLLRDEATDIKNIESLNYRFTRDFIGEDRPLVLLTGTPLSTPEDAYAYVKLIAPNIYRNKRFFDNLHVEKRDFFGNVSRWSNLDILHDNMKVNSCRLLKAEHLPHLPKPIYTPIPYELDPKHKQLYDKLVEEQLLELEDGGKIDATSVSKLFTCCQQIILNWGHFSGDPADRSNGFELLDTVLEEIDAKSETGGKLIIFANYRMTMRAVTEHLKGYGVRLINGEVTPRQREEAISEFIDNPACRTLAIQAKSGGYGVDGLQNVCRDVLFLECPTSPIEFEQAVGRVYRLGQRDTPNIRIAVAEQTIQVRLHQILLRNNELTNYVQGGIQSLREALYGGGE